MRIDFPRVAAHLLARAEILVPSWLPCGKRRGSEWVCGDLHGEPGDSCSVNLLSGKWSDFATGDKGGDLVSLYAAIHSLSQAEAAAELCPEDDAQPRSPPPRTNGHAMNGVTQKAAHDHGAEDLGAPEAAPVDAPPPSPTGMTGQWLYHRPPAVGPVLVVCRLPTEDGGKTFRQYTWRTGRMGGRSADATPTVSRWVAKGYGDDRPLYHLPELLASPTGRVLVVEGEKAADAAQAALGPSWIVTTWSGGANAVRKSDWMKLKGRGSAEAPVVIWPDADSAGRKAAAEVAGILMGLGCAVAVMSTDGRPDGWDAADANPAEITALLVTAALIQRPERLTRANASRAGGAPNGGAVIEAGGNHAPSGGGRVICDGSAFVTWQSLGLECNGNGQPFATLGNSSLVLTKHPELAGKIWRDTFRDRIYHNLQGEPKPWTDAEALRLTAWMNQVMRLPKVGLDTVHHAVELAAANNPRNSVTEWLESITWDGIERLSDWLADCLGVIKTAFTQAVARNWLISMVARAYRPGCQADHMPVLEGSSGAGKSSALAILGGEWYRAAPQAFGSKEFLEVIQGAWLIEIPDMVGFGRREHSQIISAITTRSDSYRASYGRNAEDHPRTVIFAATSETDEYLQDSRGKRRYWPVVCTDIALTALAAAREQLFAEAVSLFHDGSAWHEVPTDEAGQEQSRRQETDIWIEKIAEYVGGRSSASVGEVATSALHLDYGRQDRAAQMRISKCLKELGFSMKVERVGSKVIRMYRR